MVFSQQIIELANKFANLTSYMSTNSTNEDLINKFQEHMIRKLHTIISNLGGEILVLKNRQFDPKMSALLQKTYQDLITIYQDLHQTDPYNGARKLIDYVLGRNTGMVLDNLDFLIKNHLQKTNESMITGKLLQHPQIKSFHELKELANYAKDFITINPLPTFSGTPTMRPPKP
jgi:hypothetical protein